MEGYCRYDGDLLENFGGITDPLMCEMICNINEKCGYFVYNEKEQNCQLHDTPSRSCDLTTGPVSPDIDDCDAEKPCDCDCCK